MLRIATPPRADWTRTVESQGLLFHSIDAVPYWDEGAYYLFEAAEVDAIEAATYRLNEMCLEAAGRVIEQRRLGEFGIPAAYHDWVAWSWVRDEHTIYGRFDLSYDGNGPPRLLEYNADTPTALLEAAVIQWFWFQDLLGSTGNRSGRSAEGPLRPVQQHPRAADRCVGPGRHARWTAGSGSPVRPARSRT